jgi:hypothetical protein
MGGSPDDSSWGSSVRECPVTGKDLYSEHDEHRKRYWSYRGVHVKNEMAHVSPPGLGPWDRISSYAQDDVDNTPDARALVGQVPSSLSALDENAGLPILETLSSPGETPIQGQITRDIGPLKQSDNDPNRLIQGFRYRARFDGV